MTDITAAIGSLRPTSSFSIRGGVIFWGDENNEQPTDSEIETERVKLQAEYDAQEYARNRAAEYPSIAELTVALYDTDDKAAIETKRAAVKAKYPKPS